MEKIRLAFPLCMFLILGLAACANNPEVIEENPEDPGTDLSPAQMISELTSYDASKHEPLSIEEDKLRLRAIGEGIGWFSDSKGPLLYEDLEGDFMVETEVKLKRLDGEAGLPEALYSSAGLLVRDPNSRFGEENWVMYNVGFQNSFYGNEMKVTRPLGNVAPEENLLYNFGFHSLSTLMLIPQENEGFIKLRMARIGNEIRCYFYNGANWEEQKPSADMEVLGNGAPFPISQFNESTFRPNELALPNSLQVGIVANPGMHPTDFDNIIIRDGFAVFSYYKSQPINSFEEALQ
ncbi:MAG: hypothetical protein AAFR61_26710 [Bacteroidota bacterium]